LKPPTNGFSSENFVRTLRKTQRRKARCCFAAAKPRRRPVSLAGGVGTRKAPLEPRRRGCTRPQPHTFAEAAESTTSDFPEPRITSPQSAEVTLLSAVSARPARLSSATRLGQLRSRSGGDWSVLVLLCLCRLRLLSLLSATLPGRKQHSEAPIIVITYQAPFHHVYSPRLYFNPKQPWRARPCRPGSRQGSRAARRGGTPACSRPEALQEGSGNPEGPQPIPGGNMRLLHCGVGNLPAAQRGSPQSEHGSSLYRHVSPRDKHSDQRINNHHIKLSESNHSVSFSCRTTPDTLLQVEVDAPSTGAEAGAAGWRLLQHHRL